MAGQSTLNFALVVHNHQPVENDDKVIEQVYRTSYSPFLKRLARFPEIKVNLHYSGYLLEWLARNHEEFVSLLGEMIDRGQAEILGGGYYEPILPVIPDEDALGQITLLSRKIVSTFGRGSKPSGLWLAERAWEPNLPEVLARAGMKYTLLDDSVFHMSGLSEEECFLPYLTESRGSSVAVFPILKKLRYFIPFKDARKTISYLKPKFHKLKVGRPVAVFGDDGEKFGAWPTTYEEVYTRRWLEKFFNLIQENKQWLETVRLSDYLVESSKALSKTYLPAASYYELMEWSLPARPSIRVDNSVSTGFWRLFLSKYPESSNLYSRMLAVSRLVNGFRGDPRAKNEALRELWKAQYNDVYWHGIFGGLYFSKFRRIAYNHLLRAQTIVEAHLQRNPGWVSVQKADDGFRIDTKALGLGFSPSHTGSITEFDYKPLALNLTDSFARRYESYHEKIAKERRRIERKKPKSVTSIHEFSNSKEAGLRDLLVYDRYPKASFLDYLLDPDTDIRDFRTQGFVELANLAGHPYNYNVGPEGSITFYRSTFTSGGERIDLSKRFVINPDRSIFSATYNLNGPHESNAALFAVEINLGSLGDSTFERAFGSPIEYPNSRELEFAYKELECSISIELDPGARVWLVPVRSVSQSESGFESNLQGVSVIVLPNFEVLSGGDSSSSSFESVVSVKKKREEEA